VRQVEFCSVWDLILELATIEDSTRGERTVARRRRATGARRTMVTRQNAVVVGELRRCHPESQQTDILVS
jgi:hypothetical protein